MAENAAEEVQQDDAEQTDERERSTIKFPYADLDNAIRIPKAVHHFGTSCSLPQLAAQLGGMKINAGGFRQMLSAAQIFGLVLLSKQTVTMTVLGQRVNDPDQEKAAKAEAFLAVPLYRAIFDRFKDAGGTLPPAGGLEQEMIRLGVVAKVADRARQTFQRSAQQAGFFAFGQDKLVMPAVGVPTGQPEQAKRDGHHQQKPPSGGDGGGRGSLLQGLIAELPSNGSQWSAEDRVAWLRLASNIFDFAYGKAEPITVKLANDSAKENAR